MSKSFKTACYLRVSTDEQNLDGQRQVVQAYVERHGLKNIVWYVDDGITGDTLDRPAMVQLRKDIAKGQIGAVVCYGVDRLARKMVEGLQLLKDWLESGIRVISVTQDFDFSGTVGKMVAGLLLGFSELEQETRRKRQAAGIAAAKAKGVYQGRKAGTTTVPVERIIELRAKGLSISETATALGISPRSVCKYQNPKTS